MESNLHLVLKDENKAREQGVEVGIDFDSILHALDEPNRLNVHLLRHVSSAVAHSQAFHVVGRPCAKVSRGAAP